MARPNVPVRYINASVFRDGANGADKHVSRRGVEELRTSMVAGCKWIVFPPQTITKCQLRRDLPTVPRIHSPGGKPQRVRVDVLNDLAIPLRETKQELGKTVVSIGCRVLWRAEQSGYTSVKPEGAARCAKSSALRLAVIDSAWVVLQAEAQIVSPLNPAQVGISHILIVPKDERIAGVGVSKIGPTGNLERRNSAVDGISAVRAWNVQRFHPEVLP